MKNYLSKFNYVFIYSVLCLIFAAYYAYVEKNNLLGLYVSAVAIFFLGISFLIDEIRKIPSVTINMNGKTEILTGNKDEHQTPNL